MTSQKIKMYKFSKNARKPSKYNKKCCVTKM